MVITLLGIFTSLSIIALFTTGVLVGMAMEQHIINKNMDNGDVVKEPEILYHNYDRNGRPVP